MFQAFTPEKVIDGLSTDFYHTMTQLPGTPTTIGWAWLQVDFKFSWNIVAAEIETRDGTLYPDLWKRQNNLEVSLSHAFQCCGCVGRASPE